MANLMHSAELAVERDDDTRVNRLLIRLYEWFSDFGSSALRPLGWLLGLAATSFFSVYCTNGAVLAADLTQYTGWRSIFVAGGGMQEFSRAFYLALQPLINPLSLFAKKPLLVPRFVALEFWLSLQGLLSVVLIALTIFAIRRRFKIA